MAHKTAILLLAALGLVGLATLLTVRLADVGAATDRASGQRLDRAVSPVAASATVSPVAVRSTASPLVVTPTVSPVVVTPTVSPVAVTPTVSPVVPSPTPSSVAGAPQPCVELPAHEAFMCVSANAFQTKDGAVYWTDYKFTRQIYWHPYGDDQSPYLTVTESYFCGPNDIGKTATEEWCGFKAPGVGANTPEWQRRAITVAGPYGAQCVIYHWDVLDSVVNPPAPTLCVDLQTGMVRSTTANEKESVLRFWQEAQEMPGPW
jgi:hypothetical protein